MRQADHHGLLDALLSTGGLMERVPLPYSRLTPACPGRKAGAGRLGATMIDESIRNKFDCQEGKGQYTIACRHCSHKWTHPDKPMAVGTILHLLNHAASHEKKQ